MFTTLVGINGTIKRYVGRAVAAYDAARAHGAQDGLGWCYRVVEAVLGRDCPDCEATVCAGNRAAAFVGLRGHVELDNCIFIQYRWFPGWLKDSG